MKTRKLLFYFCTILVSMQIFVPILSSTQISYNPLSPDENPFDKIEKIKSSQFLKNEFIGSYFGGDSTDLIVSVKSVSDGKIVILGQTNSTDLPVTPDALNSSNNGNVDIFLAVVNETCGEIDFCTYLGGTMDDFPVEMKIQNENTVCISGYTNSSDFPTTPNSFDTTYNGNFDTFFMKIDVIEPNLECSTFLGNTGDDFCFDFELDLSGSPILVGSTSSIWFPVTQDGIDRYYNGNKDGYITKFNPSCTSIDFSSFIGGSLEDEISDISIGDSEILICGNTNSSDLPIPTEDQSGVFKGQGDVFLYKISLGPIPELESQVIIGGSSEDKCASIEVFEKEIFIWGSTKSNDLEPAPMENLFQGGEWDAFLFSIDLYNFSQSKGEYWGKSGNEQAFGLFSDRYGRLFFTGITDNVSGYPFTSDAIDIELNGSTDGFVGMLDDGNISYLTLVGGSGFESEIDVFIDRYGRPIVFGCSNSTDFPLSEQNIDTNCEYEEGIIQIILPDFIIQEEKYNTSIPFGGQETLRWFVFASTLEKQIYQIQLNSSVILVGECYSGDIIEYQIETEQIGTHELSLTVVNSEGESIKNSLEIEIVNENPVILGEMEKIFYNSNDSIDVSWWISDSSVKIGSFDIFQNDTKVKSGIWVESGYINMSLRNNQSGIYRMHLVVHDGIGGIAEYNTTVCVYGFGIQPQEDMRIIKGDLKIIKWTIIATVNRTALYTIYVNGEKKMDASWGFGEIISFNLSSLDYGKHQIVLAIFDGTTLATDEVLVDVSEDHSGSFFSNEMVHALVFGLVVIAILGVALNHFFKKRQM